MLAIFNFFTTCGYGVLAGPLGNPIRYEVHLAVSPVGLLNNNVYTFEDDYTAIFQSIIPHLYECALGGILQKP
jgi:hypothetical protein